VSGGKETRLTLVSDAFNGPADRAAVNGRRPLPARHRIGLRRGGRALSESLCRSAVHVNRNVSMRTTLISTALPKLILSETRELMKSIVPEVR
jgi:hypothetical protein